MEAWKQHWRRTPRPARRVIVLAVGIICIIAGAIMLVLPGPGWATIFLGLAILATEFERAERFRSRLLKRLQRAIKGFTPRRKH